MIIITYFSKDKCCPKGTRDLHRWSVSYVELRYRTGINVDSLLAPLGPNIQDKHKNAEYAGVLAKLYIASIEEGTVLQNTGFPLLSLTSIQTQHYTALERMMFARYLQIYHIAPQTGRKPFKFMSLVFFETSLIA